MAIFNTVPPLAAGSGMQFDGEVISTRAAPRNLLDNSNFLQPVNQRGNSKYVGGVYGIDRWRAFDSVAVVNVSSDGINVSGGNLYQYLDFGTADKTKTYTMACKLSNGETEVISGVPNSGVFGTKIGFAYSTDVGTVYVELKPGNTFAWAALYEGTYSAETLPEYQPKGYAEERLACTRYFMVANAWRPIYGNVSWNGNISLTVPTSVEMRINPTGTVIKGTLYVNGVNIDINENPANVIKTSNGLQVILSTKAEANAKHNCTIEINDTAIYFSADL